jgi:hypothetical protein
MSAASARYYINGKDLYDVFGIIPGPGSSNGFLQFPKKKDGITHDWLDANGTDNDLTRIYFEEKEITLNCALIADTTDQFWIRYNGFFAEIGQPGTQRLTITELDRSFFIFHRDCNGFTRFTRLKSGKIACKFNWVVVEQEPQLNPKTIILSDEQGRLICT